LDPSSAGEGDAVLVTAKFADGGSKTLASIPRGPCIGALEDAATSACVHSGRGERVDGDARYLQAGQSAVHRNPIRAAVNAFENAAERVIRGTRI
jgi:hypothetical protein